jgi:chromosome segregation ATPase
VETALKIVHLKNQEAEAKKVMAEQATRIFALQEEIFATKEKLEVAQQNEYFFKANLEAATQLFSTNTDQQKTEALHNLFKEQANKIKFLEEYIRNLEQHLGRFRALNQSMEVKHFELLSHISYLETNLNPSTVSAVSVESTKEVNEYEKEVQEQLGLLKEQNRKLATDFDSLKENLQRTIDENEQLKLENGTLVVSSMGLEDEIKSLQSRVNEFLGLSQELQQLKVLDDELNAKFLALEKLSQEEKQDWSKEKAQLVEAFETSQQYNSHLSDKILEYLAEIQKNELFMDENKSKEIIQGLSRMYAECLRHMSVLCNKLAFASEKNEFLDGHRVQLEGAYTALQLHTGALEEDRQALLGKIQQLEVHQRELSAVKNTLQNELKTLSDEKKRHARDITALEVEKDKLLKRINTAAVQHSGLGLQKAQLEEKLKKLQEISAEQVENVRKLEALQSEWAQKYQNLERLHEELRVQKSSLEEELESSLQQNHKYVSDIALMGRDNATLIESVALLEGQQREFLGEKAQLEERIRKVFEERAVLSKRVDALEDDSQRLSADNNMLDYEVNRLDEEVGKYKKEVETSRQEAEKFKLLAERYKSEAEHQRKKRYAVEAEHSRKKSSHEKHKSNHHSNKSHHSSTDKHKRT